MSAPLLRSGPLKVSSSLSPTDGGALSKKMRAATATWALESGLTLARRSFALFSEALSEPPHAATTATASVASRSSAARMTFLGMASEWHRPGRFNRSQDRSRDTR